MLSTEPKRQEKGSRKAPPRPIEEIWDRALTNSGLGKEDHFAERTRALHGIKTSSAGVLPLSIHRVSIGTTWKETVRTLSCEVPARERLHLAGNDLNRVNPFGGP